MSPHETYMQRCLELAELGIGTTRPNPSVGCVIVHDGQIIGEGFTSPYGGNHAEVNAIDSIENKTLLKSSSLYVTLEPCSHFGKTPPCSDMIIKEGIKEVFIGTSDINSKVSGAGIKKLKDSGCMVHLGVLEKECKQHHRRFFTFHGKKRPHIILKWAESKDGFIAPKSKLTNRPVWITSPNSRQLVHKWRTQEHAILIGANTARKDNPKLTSRHWDGNNPIRVVIDAENKLSRDLDIFNNDAETIVISNSNIDFNKPIAQQICDLLFARNIQSLIVEGGTKTLKTFIDENLWDEARIFIGPESFNDGLKAPKLKSRCISNMMVSSDKLKAFKNQNL